MQAVLVQKKRIHLGLGRFVDVSIWRLPHPLRGSEHCFKYRLALIIEQACALRYDNEAGKGDHKHVGDAETPYRFTTLDQLVEDFWSDVQAYGGSQ